MGLGDCLSGKIVKKSPSSVEKFDSEGQCSIQLRSRTLIAQTLINLQTRHSTLNSRGQGSWLACELCSMAELIR